MRIIKEGAEAEIIQTNYLGIKSIVKRRKRKKYRERSLDARIQKKRVRQESALLTKAKEFGIRTPFIYKINLEKLEITMEYVEGKTLSETLNKKNAGALLREAGKIIGTLHKNKVVHGDLTTSNFIHNKGLVLVDFGLGRNSEKLGDFAADVLGFKKTFFASHFKLEKCWREFEKAYKKENGSGKAVLEQMERIEKRARYS